MGFLDDKKFFWSGSPECPWLGAFSVTSRQDRLSTDIGMLTGGEFTPPLLVINKAQQGHQNPFISLHDVMLEDRAKAAELYAVGRTKEGKEFNFRLYLGSKDREGRPFLRTGFEWSRVVSPGIKWDERRNAWVILAAVGELVTLTVQGRGNLSHVNHNLSPKGWNADAGLAFTMPPDLVPGAFLELVFFSEELGPGGYPGAWAEKVYVEIGEREEVVPLDDPLRAQMDRIESELKAVRLLLEPKLVTDSVATGTGSEPPIVVQEDEGGLPPPEDPARSGD